MAITLLEFKDRLNAAVEGARPHMRAFGEELTAACQEAIATGIDPKVAEPLAQQAYCTVRQEIERPMWAALLRRLLPGFAKPVHK